MKPAEYYNKYAEDLMLGTKKVRLAALKSLVEEFTNETVKLKEEKGISTNKAAVKLIREMNSKWNTLVRLFIKKNGASPIQKDGYWNVMESLIPELKKERIRR